ncbi:hypothetical protein GGF32_005291 [Allomyces javanicus]|nr:hypothetical protein GGF32_005291 [Allomyces javanicus]
MGSTPAAARDPDAAAADTTVSLATTTTTATNAVAGSVPTSAPTTAPHTPHRSLRRRLRSRGKAAVGSLKGLRHGRSGASMATHGGSVAVLTPPARAPLTSDIDELLRLEETVQENVKKSHMDLLSRPASPPPVTTSFGALYVKDEASYSPETAQPHLRHGRKNVDIDEILADVEDNVFVTPPSQPRGMSIRRKSVARRVSIRPVVLALPKGRESSRRWSTPAIGATAKTQMAPAPGSRTHMSMCNVAEIQPPAGAGAASRVSLKDMPIAAPMDIEQIMTLFAAERRKHRRASVVKHHTSARTSRRPSATASTAIPVGTATLKSPTSKSLRRDGARSPPPVAGVPASTRGSGSPTAPAAPTSPTAPTSPIGTTPLTIGFTPLESIMSAPTSPTGPSGMTRSITTTSMGTTATAGGGGRGSISSMAVIMPKGWRRGTLASTDAVREYQVGSSVDDEIDTNNDAETVSRRASTSGVVPSPSVVGTCDLPTVTETSVPALASIVDEDDGDDDFVDEAMTDEALLVMLRALPRPVLDVVYVHHNNDIDQLLASPTRGL